MEFPGLSDLPSTKAIQPQLVGAKYDVSSSKEVTRPENSMINPFIFPAPHRLTTSGSLPGETQGSGLHRARRPKAEVSRPMAQPVLHSSKVPLCLELYGQTGHQSLATFPTDK